MSKKMLINVVEPEESRIAILEDNTLEELYIERISKGQTVGNIYMGRVSNIEPSLEAAFVDIGLKRNGFLHISEVLNAVLGEEEKAEKTRSKKEQRRIQSLLKPGQELLVQIIREGVGEKGPSLTGYISLPGRYLVLMPYATRHGVSRKILDEEERARLKQIIKELKPPANMGLIVRTAGAGQTKRELSKDLNYLLRLWKAVEERQTNTLIPSLIYQESDLVIRTIRDIFSPDIEEIIVDSEDTYRKTKDFLKQIMPKYVKSVRLHRARVPIFHKYRIEEEIEMINNRKIPLKQGGSLVIEQTEALVAIDVNSGRFKKGADPEETAFRTNIEATKEIVRQIRLRDLGGVIIIDFIDMQQEPHRRAVEKALADALKKDWARTKMLKMSKFGIVEITRQRIKRSLRDALYESCPECGGTGFTKTVESLSLNIMREIRSALDNKELKTIEVVADNQVAQFLQNQKRKHISELEDHYSKRIVVKSAVENGWRVGDIRINYFNSDGRPIDPVKKGETRVRHNKG
ncbi:MAG: ribonuclease E/G [Candidatus Brocadiales bacterium]